MVGLEGFYLKMKKKTLGFKKFEILWNQKE